MDLVRNSGDDRDDPAARLTAAGGPFEMDTLDLDGVPTRVFRQGPATLAEVYAVAAGFHERVFCTLEDRCIGYRELFGRAAALADHLAVDHGTGARIAIAMQNSPEWMIAFVAITALGATAVLVNSRGTPAEMDAALTTADATLTIADAPRAAALAGRPLLVTGADFDRATAGWEQAELRPVPRRPEDEALVMFTSGTTGGSKAVLLDQRGVTTGLMNIQFSMAVIGARLAQRYGADAIAAAAARQPSALLAVPLFHASGCYSIFLSNLLRGGRIAILPKWNAAQALSLLARERITAFSGAPTMLWDLLRQDRGGYDLSALMSVGVGGQALQPQLLREIVAAFPQAILGGGYGMTESNGSVCLIAGEDLLNRPTSSGRVLATADLKLVDDDDREVAQGAVGEICLRGAMLMRGYCKRPEDTAKVLRGGWLHTGDLGRLDTDGYLHVIDRKKDIIISGGENIACTEVEGAAIEHPAVAEAAAFGIADERLGESLVLAVVALPGASLDPQALKDHIAQRLAIYKVPRQLFTCEELPRNALGKIDRNALRRRYLAAR